MIDTDLTDRTAIVTGGSRGIGAATALALGEAGASVALTYHHSEEKACEVADRIQHTGSKALVVHLDMQSSKSIERLVTRTMDEFGRVDILVNNAAVGTMSVNHYADSGSLDESMFGINSIGTLRCAQAVLPIMVDQNYGKIINISSVGGGIGVFPYLCPSDAMSKCTVAYLSKHIVSEYPHQRIDAFSICPGAVDTRMFRESTLNHLSPEEREAFIARLPGGRLIEPVEIAKLILFLCSPAATICRGAVIDASLGLGVRPGLVTEIL